MKKILKKVFLALLALLFTLVLVIGFIFRYEISALTSLKKVNDYPFYTMTYSGDYGFDDFLTQGATNDSELISFSFKKLLKGYQPNFLFSKVSCTAFTATTPDDKTIYGRNFDFPYSPSLLLKTHPKNGYSSLSMVNLAFMGYSGEKLPNGLGAIPTLISPYLPFDGINEKGLVIACLATRDEPQPKPTGKTMLNTTTVMRLALDQAATVDEALSLLSNYDVYFSQDLVCHYLIADANGHSAIIEFTDDGMAITKPTDNFQVCTNFIVRNGNHQGNGLERFDEATRILKKKNGILSEQEAMQLLNTVNIRNYLPDPTYTGDTQWSIVFNTTDLSMNIAINRDYDNIYTYNLKD